MMLFDFKCPECENIQEEFVASTTHWVACNSCQAIAHRVISGTSFRLDGTDPAFPTAYAGWEKKRLSKKDGAYSLLINVTVKGQLQ